MEDREIRKVLDVLDNAGIRYRMVSHDPVYTIEEMERLHLDADAEIANAALYDKDLLPRVRDVPAVTAVFTALSSASTRNHLPAFERCGSGGGGRRAGLIPGMLHAAFAPVPW